MGAHDGDASATLGMTECRAASLFANGDSPSVVPSEGTSLFAEAEQITWAVFSGSVSGLGIDFDSASAPDTGHS